MQKKSVKIARVVSEIFSGQTDTQTYSSQYFATAAAGEVMFNAYGTTVMNTFRQKLKTCFFRQRQTSSDDAVALL